MADYQAMYQSKLKTAQQVAAMVESGWVFGMDAAPTQADGIMNARLSSHGLTMWRSSACRVQFPALSRFQERRRPK